LEKSLRELREECVFMATELQTRPNVSEKDDLIRDILLEFGELMPEEQEKVIDFVLTLKNKNLS